MIELAGLLEQDLTGVRLELLPARDGVDGQRGVERIAIADSEHARLSVRRASIVEASELLEEHHAAAGLGQLPRGSRPHRSCTDYDDIHGIAHADNPSAK